MIKYQGTKTLGASPMSRGEYNTYRGWDVPTNENPDDAGYLVEYDDGGAGNDSRHVGYISWSPKDVFERTYKRVLAPHQQRVVDELVALETKFLALGNFFCTPVHSGLPLAERDRLSRQYLCMDRYAGVLRERIAKF